jgi:hypothetical protein
MTRSPRTLFAALLLLAPGLLSASLAAQAPNTLTPKQVKEGWTLLFDGTTTNGWHGWRSDSVPSGWRAENGTLTRVAPAGDIATNGKYRNFELELDWSVDPGGVSGVLFRADERVVEAAESGPEMAVLDDSLQADGRSPLTAAGSVPGLYPTDLKAVHPAGAWNHVRILVQGRRVQQWLNDRKTADYVLESPAWVQLVHKSRYDAWPQYGRGVEGSIVLRDQGTTVRYANIRIRVLP